MRQDDQVIQGIRKMGMMGGEERLGGIQNQGLSLTEIRN